MQQSTTKLINEFEVSTHIDINYLLRLILKTIGKMSDGDDFGNPIYNRTWFVDSKGRRIANMDSQPGILVINKIY